MAQRQTSGKRLKFNHSSAVPRYIIALDCETLPEPLDTDGRRFSHRLRLAVAITGRYRDGKIYNKQVHYLDSKAAIWRLIKSYTGLKYTTYVVCHNALFDMVVSGMPEEFENASLTVDAPRSVRQRPSSGMEQPSGSGIVCIESPPFIIGARVGSSQGRLVILDTLNWFQCPLSDLGRSLGSNKLQMPQFGDTNQNWYRYCHRDTEITFESFVGLIGWIRDNDMGMFRYTGPAQAMAAYRHRFKTHDILLHDNLPIKVVERSAYFGGRFECWKLGPINEIVHQLDVNALFPSVMAGMLYPVALDVYDHPAHFSAESISELGHDCIAEVEIQTRTANYPHRCDKGVSYPVGTFRTTLCGLELAAAISSGEIKAARAWGRYKLEPIFSKWVAELWRMRQEFKASGNLLYEQFVKMLMNSLYGKFGQRSPEWENIPDRSEALPWQTWHTYDAKSGEMIQYRSFGWQVQRRRDREERHHAEMEVTEWESHAKKFGEGEIDTSFVAIAAFVTANARGRMNELRAIAGAENVYYQGVDSLIVTNDGRQRLGSANQVSESELGKLRLQLTANYGEINGCNDYRIGDKVVLSGLSRTPQANPQVETLQRSFAAKPHLFKGKASDEVIEENSVWRKTAQYWKGTVDQFGQVAPLELVTGGNCSSTPSIAEDAAVSASAVTVEP